MAGADLTRAITFRGFALNTVVETNGVLIGCKVSLFDPSEVEIVQFTEKLAKQDGLDVGPVYIGGRRLSMTGTVYDTSRGATFDRLESLESIMVPVSGGFGFYDLTYYVPRVAGPGFVLKTVSVRPNGLRYTMVSEMFGGSDSQPLAIPWSVTFLAKNPAIT